MASSAPPAVPANSGCGVPASSHFHSTSDHPIAEAPEEEQPNRQQPSDQQSNSNNPRYNRAANLRIQQQNTITETEGPISSRLRRLPGRYLSTTQLPSYPNSVTGHRRRSSGTASPAPQRRSRLSLPASLSGVERALPQSSAGRNPNDRSSSNSTTPGVAQRRNTVESSTTNENPTTQVRQRKRTRTGEAPGTSSSTAEASNVSAEANSPNSAAPAARTRSTYSSPLKKARLQSKNPQQQQQQTSNSRSNIGAGHSHCLGGSTSAAAGTSAATAAASASSGSGEGDQQRLSQLRHPRHQLIPLPLPRP